MGTIICTQLQLSRVFGTSVVFIIDLSCFFLMYMQKLPFHTEPKIIFQTPLKRKSVNKANHLEKRLVQNVGCNRYAHSVRISLRSGSK